MATFCGGIITTRRTLDFFLILLDDEKQDQVKFCETNGPVGAGSREGWPTGAIRHAELYHGT